MPSVSPVHDLKTLIQSAHSLIAIETSEEDRVISLVRTVAEQLHMEPFEWTITRGFGRLGARAAVVGTLDPFLMLKHIEGLTIPGIFVLKDFSRHLEDQKVARQFRELVQECATRRSTLIVTGASVVLTPEVAPDAIRYGLRLPDQHELSAVVTSVIRSVHRQPPITVTLTEDDRAALMRALQGLTLNQARQAIASAVVEDRSLTAEDIPRLLRRKMQLIKEGGLLEYYPADDNAFELGGFAALKLWLDRARVGFTPQARAMNLPPPRGILLVGVPGCGKSLAAKVIAREWSLPLLKLDAGRLFDKYIGESEKNFRAAIDLAQSLAPVVFWLDEIEKGIVATGGSEADAGLSRRLFGAFLTWLQEKQHEVFVVATANDLSLLPPELLRKGRFDEVFFVDLPTQEERRAIFSIHLLSRKQDPAAFDLGTIADASEGFSGAEIEQAIVASLYRALHRQQPLTTVAVLEELRATIPLSVSRREDIQRLQTLARDRFVGVR